MYLFFDVETGGLPKNYKAPITDLDNWPRVVQLAWALFNKDAYMVHCASYIFCYPKEMPKKLVEIHGIDNNMIKQYCVPYKAFDRFNGVCNHAQTKFLVAHNIDFDYKIVAAELLRLKLPLNQSKLKQICTMKSATNFCKIPGNYNRYKWPKLVELHKKLFQLDIDSAHNAMYDVFATAKCFFELKKLNVITVGG